MGSLLELLGEHFGFTASYIFELVGDSFVNSFSWRDEQSPQLMDRHGSVSVTDFNEIMPYLLENGMYAQPDMANAPKEVRGVLFPEGIKSMYLFTVRAKGRVAGFIGFDDCVKEHQLTPEDMDELATLCSLIETFLLGGGYRHEHK